MSKLIQAHDKHFQLVCVIKEKNYLKCIRSLEGPLWKWEKCKQIALPNLLHAQSEEAGLAETNNTNKH